MQAYYNIFLQLLKTYTSLNPRALFVMDPQKRKSYDRFQIESIFLYFCILLSLKAFPLT